ncbi:hypothetical protein H8959_012992, partial [Pygathrix nigripes]
TDLRVSCIAGGVWRGWRWRGPGSRCPGSTTSTCWSRRSTCWSPGSGRCSIQCWFPLWGWHYTQDTSSCPSTSWRYCTTLKLYNDQDAAGSEVPWGRPTLQSWNETISCDKKLF